MVQVEDDALPVLHDDVLDKQGVHEKSIRNDPTFVINGRQGRSHVGNHAVVVEVGSHEQGHVTLYRKIVPAEVVAPSPCKEIGNTEIGSPTQEPDGASNGADMLGRHLASHG